MNDNANIVNEVPENQSRIGKTLELFLNIPLKIREVKRGIRIGASREMNKTNSNRQRENAFYGIFLQSELLKT